MVLNNVIIANCLVHVPGFLSQEKAGEIIRTLMREHREDFQEISGGGRSMARYGSSYTYRGRSLKTYPWRSCLLELRDSVSEACRSLGMENDFNAAVCNLYKREDHELPMHSDTRAIPQLGKEPVIACISLGAERPVLLQEKKTGRQTRLMVSSGDLYIMHGISQSHFLHGAPASEHVCMPRVSITFRIHK